MSQHERRYRLRCERCERRFNASREDAKFCSPACRQASYRDSRTSSQQSKSPGKPPSKPQAAAYDWQADLMAKAKQTEPDDWDDDWGDEDEPLPTWQPTIWQEQNKISARINGGESVLLYPLEAPGDKMPPDGIYNYRTIGGAKYQLPHHKVGRPGPYKPTPEQIARKARIKLNDQQTIEVYPKLNAEGEQAQHDGKLVWITKVGQVLEFSADRIVREPDQAQQRNQAGHPGSDGKRRFKLWH